VHVSALAGAGKIDTKPEATLLAVIEAKRRGSAALPRRSNEQAP
jgi:hypothetical protein